MAAIVVRDLKKIFVVKESAPVVVFAAGLRRYESGNRLGVRV